MMSRISLGLAAAATCMAVTASADNITINGQTYTEVLVYESPSVYFVKLPAEGRIVSAPKSKVDKSTVVINDDPFYRDRLKAQFDKAEANAAASDAGPAQPRDPAFNVPEASGSGSNLDSSGLYSQGGGGSGLNVPKQMILGALTQQGYTASGAGMKSPDGSVTIATEGPDENITGLVVTISATQAEMPKLFMGMQQMSAMASGMAPWAGPWITQNIAQLQGGQTIQKTQEGVFISVSPAQNGQNISITFTIRGA